MVSFQNLTPKRLLPTGTLLLLTGTIVKWILLPGIIKWQISVNVNLGKDSFIRKFWANYPDPFTFKVYLFNITNPIEVQNGGKPSVTEIGPYVYEEYKEKAELYDHEEDDTVSFNNRDVFHFNRLESAPLTGDEMVTIPHILILGLVLATEKELVHMFPLVNKSIPIIFGQNDSVFLTATARDLIFDGILYNCSFKDFVSRIICLIVRARGKDLVKVGWDSFRFSFIGKKNATLAERLRLKRGLLNVKDVGRLVAMDNLPRMNTYRDSTCNEFLGTDTSIFPPLMGPGESLQAFSTDICRSLDIKYEGNTEYRGIRGYKYTADLGNPSEDPELKCYCTTQSTCLRKGVHDLQMCKDAPLVASFPHFFMAAREYLDGITGLRPLKRIHETTVHLEPLTGTPLLAYKRVQFNVRMRRVRKLELTRNLPTVLIPAIWVEEGVKLTEELVKLLKLVLTLLKIVNAFLWTAMAVGLFLVCTAFFFLVQKLTRKTIIKLGRISPEVSSLGGETPERY